MSSSAWVLNVQAPNEVIAVLPFHASVKFVPRDRFRAGKEVNLQSSHVLVKLMSSSAWEENVTAGKEVKLALEQPRHAEPK